MNHQVFTALMFLPALLIMGSMLGFMVLVWMGARQAEKDGKVIYKNRYGQWCVRDKREGER